LNLIDARKLFPITDSFINLNNAAESPLNSLVKTRLLEYLEFSENYPHKKPNARTKTREYLSMLFGGSKEDYSLATSTGHGLGIVASGFKWSEGDNVILPEKEHWNNSYPWILQEKKGVEVRFSKLKNNRIDYENLASLVDENTRIISLAAVRFNSGYRVDLKKMRSIADINNSLLVVDGIQATGAIPINVIDDGIDVLAAAGFKWLLGLPGTGFLYVNERARKRINPVMPGMFASELEYDSLNFFNNSKKYETGTIAYPLFYAWEAGLNLLLEIGIDSIHKKIITLTDILIEDLHKKGYEITTPISSKSERSGIVIFKGDSKEKTYELFQKILSKNIVVTFRENAIRVSPSFYNTEEEILTLCSIL